MLAALALAGLVVWGTLVSRLYRRQPVIARQPRRPVPWGLPELLLILAVYLALQAAVLGAAWLCLGPKAIQPPVAYQVNQANTQHVVTRLLDQAQANPLVFLLCGFAAVVAAPIAEEFLYRLVLQGWLERQWEQWSPRMPRLRCLLPGATGPIVLVAFVFARAHFRVPSAPPDPRFHLFMLVGLGVAGLLTVVAAVGVLRIRVQATWADLGWDVRRLPADATVGALVFVAVAAPLYALQSGLSAALPKYLTPDPFTLFPFALVLGFLYYRTHRLGSPIVLHMLLNATTLLLAWLAMSGAPGETGERPPEPATQQEFRAPWQTDCRSLGGAVSGLDGGRSVVVPYQADVPDRAKTADGRGGKPIHVLSARPRFATRSGSPRPLSHPLFSGRPRPIIGFRQFG